MKKNEAMTLELNALRLSSSQVSDAYQALMKTHESLSLAFLTRKQENESLKIVHEELEASISSLQNQLLSVPQEAAKVPCEKCTASAKLIASDASVASSTNEKHTTMHIDSVINCANPLSRDITSILEENTRLQILLEVGMLKCRKGSETLCELLSKQRLVATKDGLGFTPRLNEDGKEWKAE
jgi:hypothetical protein